MKKIIILSLLVISPLLHAEQMRFSIGEKKHIFFPGLKKFENLNTKLIRAHIDPEKSEVTLTALSKGSGQFHVKDQKGYRIYDVTVYGKLSLDYERELKELTESIEGIRVRSVGHKIMITGQVLTAQDLRTLKTIEKHYDNVINLAIPRPSSSAFALKKMIQMEVKLIELNTHDIEALGLELPDAFNIQTQLQASLISARSDFNLILNTLQKKGWAKIIANPKLVCKNGEEADFLAGGEVPIRIATHKRMSVQWKSYGISLKMQPTADHQNHISTSLKVEVSALDYNQQIDGLPGLLTRKLNTVLNVKNKESIVISGLTHERNSREQRDIPLLSKIPLLGRLFQSYHDSAKKTELIIFVTPSIHINTKEIADASNFN